MSSFIEASKADGYWYGTIKPNKELAQPEQRIRRRQILEGGLEPEAPAMSNGSSAPRSLPEPEPAAATTAATATTPAAPTVTEVDDEPTDAQIQSIVLARKVRASKMWASTETGW